MNARGARSYGTLALFFKKQRGIAQFGRASGPGPEGRSFEYCYPDCAVDRAMVAVAQLAEHPVVIRKVTGSSPVGHPKE